MMESTKGVCQRYRNGVTKDCYTFHSEFSSSKSEENVMEVFSKLIGMVKTNTNRLCKGNI